MKILNEKKMVFNNDVVPQDALAKHCPRAPAALPADTPRRHQAHQDRDPALRLQLHLDAGRDGALGPGCGGLYVRSRD